MTDDTLRPPAGGSLLSLHEFGRRCGCDYTTASRLLSGDRVPSTRLLARICSEFGLDHGVALRALAKDQAGWTGNQGKSPVFAEFLRVNVFEADGQRPLSA
jgi:transcriptional regulator with XRE-family HTH domain